MDVRIGVVIVKVAFAIFFSVGANAEPYVDLVQYRYDALNRLIDAQSGEGIGQSFVHDHVSNRITESRRDAPIGAPRARSDAYTLNQGQTFNASVDNGLLLNDSFEADQTVSASAITSPLFGALSLAEDGSFTYQPNQDFFGTDEFAYQITSDQTGFSSNIVRVRLVVLPTNPQPIANLDQAQTMEDTPVLVPVLLNDLNVNTIISVESPFNGSAQIQDNQILYTPNPNYSGQDIFSYIAQGSEGISQARVNISIEPANDPPQAFNIDARISLGDTALFPILSHVVDPEGDEVQLVSVTNIDGSENPAIQINDAVVSYTPTEFIPTNTSGTSMFEQFVYTVVDSEGNQSQGLLFNFTFANAEPVAVNDCYDQSASAGCVTNTEYIIEPNTPRSLNVIANDFDIAGELLTVSRISNDPNRGTAIIQNNRVLYTPDAGEDNRTDFFNYEITDGSGNTSQARVFLFIREIDNSANTPIARDDCFERSSLSPTCGTSNDYLVDYASEVTFDNVLVNDSDPNGEALEISSVGRSLQGVLISRIGNRLVYQAPDDGPIGGFLDAFTYEIRNSESRLSSQATVYIEVKPRDNIAPTASNDSFIVLTNRSRDLNLIANDEDRNFDNLRIDPQSLSTPAQGTVSVISSGVVRYTPFHNADGADSFTYRVLDPSGVSSNTASVTINIRDLVPLAPIYQLLLFDDQPDTTSTPAEGN